MQNSNGIAANKGAALRELSLDEAEMVGGGFSWGGLVHGVEHAADNVLSGAEGAIGGGLAVGLGKGLVKAVQHIKLPKFSFRNTGPEPGPELPELPPEIFLG
jgi:hypothetical protein